MKEGQKTECKPFRVGLIRVLTSDDQDFIDMHGRVIMEHFPGLEVISRCIPDQWEGIHTMELHRQAVPKIVALAKSFENVDMILVSCADDPGLEELRAALPGIPVTGAGETTAALAYKYSDRIGVIVISDYTPPSYVRMFGDKLMGVEKPDGVNSTLDLMTPEGRENCIRSAKKLRDMGAGVIALACTGMTTIGIAETLEKETGLPVIDPVLAEGLLAYFESIRYK